MSDKPIKYPAMSDARYKMLHELGVPRGALAVVTGGAKNAISEPGEATP